MSGLMKQQLKLLFMPDALVDEFKEMVFANYFDGNVFDVKSLARNTDIFSLYRKCYLETGDPFDRKNDYALVFAKKGENVIINDLDELQMDVQIMMNHYKMFHAKEFNRYRGLIDCRFIPSSNVW